MGKRKRSTGESLGGDC